MLYDALIVGAGPAGLSAALALGRVRRSALVFDSGAYRNAGVHAMHTVLSRDGMDPADFRATAIDQIKRYPSIHFKHSRVTKLARREVLPGYMGFEAVDGDQGTHTSRKLILATGTEDILPQEFPGYQENWPSHIYQCLFCDGFDEKDHPIGVLTFPNAGYNHLVLMALQFNRDVTIYSNGPVSEDTAVQQALRVALASQAKLDTRKVTRLINNGPGPERGITLEFENGPNATLGMLLHRPPTRNRAQHLIDQLALKAGKGGEPVIDPVFAETSIQGCFAAGDTAEPVKQVSLAMGAGVRAGAVVSMQLCNEEGARALASANGSND